MSNSNAKPRGLQAAAGRFRRPLTAGVVIIVLSGLSACSSVPDAVNPAEWYKSTVDFFAGEDGQGQVAAEQDKAVPGAEKPFPKLSSVPDRPATSVQGGLVADTDKRKYAQPIARQGEATEMLAARPPASPPPPSAAPAAPAPVVAAVQPFQPAPPAVPATPVERAVPVPAAPVISSTPPPTAAPAPAMPANAMASVAYDPFATVVVSSSGIEMAAAPVSEPAAVTNAAPALPAKGAIGGTKVATILFNSGSSGISRRDRQILGQVVRLHQQRGGTVTVVGHASSRTRNMDPVRHKMVNYRVSVDRADTIARELRAMGMAPEMIVVDARSDNMPLYYETMPSGEAGNRRAEIYFQN